MGGIGLSYLNRYLTHTYTHAHTCTQDAHKMHTHAHTQNRYKIHTYTEHNTQNRYKIHTYTSTIQNTDTTIMQNTQNRTTPVQNREQHRTSTHIHNTILYT